MTGQANCAAKALARACHAQHLQRGLGQGRVVAGCNQVPRLARCHRIHNAAGRKGHGRQAMGGGFNGDHAKAFGVAGQVAHGEDVQGGAFIGAGQLLRVGNHAQKAQVLANACGIGHGLDAGAGLHAGVQRVGRGFTHHGQQGVGRRLNDGGQCMLHKFAQAFAGGQAAHR